MICVWRISVVLGLVLPLLGACSIMPAGGPTTEELEENAKNNPLGFTILDLTPTIARRVESSQTSSATIFTEEGTSRLIGVDDVLQISIFEVGVGLFSSTANTDGAGTAKATSLPSFSVGRDGKVTIPYIGRIKAAGFTADQLRQQIEIDLKGRASQPQVTVNISANISNTVIISGDVRNPGRYPLTASPEHLLDAVALAGGPLNRPLDTHVEVIRRDHRETKTLGLIDPLKPEDILLEAGDRIRLTYQPRTFMAFGATGRVDEISFSTVRVSLAQAIARVAGANDAQADPEGVYLFRFEPPLLAASIGLGTNEKSVPVVYRINLRDPTAYFAVSDFSMRDKDILLVTDARGLQLHKFLGLLSAMFAPASVASPIVYATH